MAESFRDGPRRTLWKGVVPMAGTARFKSLEWFDPETRICIVDYTLQPPTTNVETGELVSVARVARYPTVDGRGWYTVVSPVDDAGREWFLHPWFAMALPRRLTNAEALARIGYTVETDSGEHETKGAEAGGSCAGAGEELSHHRNAGIPAEQADPA